jgi:hypothetical protein
MEDSSILEKEIEDLNFDEHFSQTHRFSEDIVIKRPTIK